MTSIFHIGSKISWLQVAPLVFILGAFLILPLVIIVVVSFWDYSIAGMYPDFIFLNYKEILFSPTMLEIYLRTLKFTALTWIFVLIIGYCISYFLIFCICSNGLRTLLLLVCTVPFWTSNVIRMIAWIPFLGRNGVINQTLMETGIVSKPLEFLLYSQFSVVMTYVHLYTLFMIVPIFNAMAKIDTDLIEAARDAGASGFQILTRIIFPLTLNGIALGSIFIITLVMGDAYVVRIMSGSQSGTIGSAMAYQISGLQYPSVAANAVILAIVVLLMVGAILRFVDVQKALTE